MRFEMSSISGDGGSANARVNLRTPDFREWFNMRIDQTWYGASDAGVERATNGGNSNAHHGL